MELVGETLDFRFADEYDIPDIAEFVNTAHEIEHTEGNDFQFRKVAPKITVSELEHDFELHSVKWVVMETAGDEVIVGSARLQLNRAVGQAGVDILCASGEKDVQTFILRLLLQKIDVIVFNASIQKIIIPIPQWRPDLEKSLTDSGYEELSGYLWPSEKESELLKPTMVLEFHKTLRRREESADRRGGAYHDRDLPGISPSAAPTVTPSAAPIIQGISFDSSTGTAIVTLEDFDLGNFQVLGANTTALGLPSVSSIRGSGGEDSSAAVSSTVAAVAAALNARSDASGVPSLSATATSTSPAAAAAAPGQDMQHLMQSLFFALHSEYPDTKSATTAAGVPPPPPASAPPLSSPSSSCSAGDSS